MKIRHHLLLLVAALVLPLVVSQADHIIEDHRDEVARTEAMLSAQAEIIATNIGAKLERAQARLEYLAAQPPHTLLDPQRCNPSLASLLELQPEYANIVSADPQGTSICSAVPHPPGKPTSVAAAPWFDRFMKEQRFLVGQPFYGPIVKRQVMVLSQPIRDRVRSDGAMLGSIHFTIDLAAFDPQLPAEHLPGDLRYGILNDRGVLFWRNDGGGVDIGRRVESDVVQRIIESRGEDFFAAQAAGGEHYFAVKPMPEFGLVAFAAQPVESVLAKPRRNAIDKIVGSLVAIVFLLVLAMVIARRIVGPVVALGEVARAARRRPARPRAAGRPNGSH